MKFQFAMLVLLITSLTSTTAQTNPVSHEVQFDYYDKTLENWFNLTMTNQGYSIASDDPLYDGLSSEVNYFNWHVFELEASDDDFFSLEQIDPNPTIILTYTRLEQSNTISVGQMPQTFAEATGWIRMLVMLFDYEQKILSIDFDKLIWPIATQMVTMESYPEQYGVTAIFQRGHDALDSTLAQNVTLFAGVDFDINHIEGWMQNSTIAASTFVSEFKDGETTEVSFPSFSLRWGSQQEIEAYPLDRVSVLITTETGMAILFSFENGFQDFVFETGIESAAKYAHDPIKWSDIPDGNSSLGVDSELPISVVSMFVAVTLVGLVKRKKFKNLN